MTEREIQKHSYRNGGNSYVLLGNQQWIAFTKNVIDNKLIPKFGYDFNLIVYWYNTPNGENIDFICIPYSAISHLLVDEHLTGKYTPRARWNFIIKDNLFCVHANTNFSVNITPYLNRLNGSNAPFYPDILGAEEGKLKYALHKTIERNSTLVNNLKSRRLQVDPKLRCEICGFSFVEKYGDIGEGFIEAHHKIPLSALEESTITREDDLILVCSNCHRMLHRSNPVLTTEELIVRLTD